jgi:hypothetical protein
VTLALKPLSLAEANAFIRAHHSHHQPVVGHKFSIGCTDDGRLCGVVVVGRPVSRVLQGEGALEVTRSCTDGTKHAASKLIAAAWRAASAMGCQWLISYTLASESGLSYRAAGWSRVEADGVPVKFGGGTWHRESRPRTEPLAGVLELRPKAPEEPKHRWERKL